MERPQRTDGSTTRLKSGCGWVYVTDAKGEEYKEVFCKLGKSGTCAASFLDGMGRLITFALNFGVPREQIIRALSGIQCPLPQFDVSTQSQTLSCCDAVAKLLKEE